MPVASSGNADGAAHGDNGALFQPGDLGLGNAQGAGHLHLGLAVIKPQGQDLLLPGSQCPEGIAPAALNSALN